MAKKKYLGDHVGKLLLKAIEKRGLSKANIAKNLGISRPTLYSRLEDGDFTNEQLSIIRERYL